ncbi:protein of unknown function [Cupriavidus taiwanensis]|uniref:Uncharacterized protein n=1 Tax=Cupriavidus taiwanensis TaxID=164546 RepID=A0A375IFA9_9BURK|nr:protein of unknown function [Cupriavidus taiwanensis]
MKQLKLGMHNAQHAPWLARLPIISHNGDTLRGHGVGLPHHGQGLGAHGPVQSSGGNCSLQILQRRQWRSEPMPRDLADIKHFAN